MGISAVTALRAVESPAKPGMVAGFAMAVPAGEFVLFGGDVPMFFDHFLRIPLSTPVAHVNRELGAVPTGWGAVIPLETIIVKERHFCFGKCPADHRILTPMGGIQGVEGAI